MRGPGLLFTLWNVLLLHRMMSGVVCDLSDMYVGKLGPKCVSFCSWISRAMLLLTWLLLLSSNVLC